MVEIARNANHQSEVCPNEVVADTQGCGSLLLHIGEVVVGQTKYGTGFENPSSPNSFALKTAVNSSSIAAGRLYCVISLHCINLLRKLAFIVVNEKAA